MTTPSVPTSPRPAVAAGLLYAGSAIGFIAVFVWLAGAFGYPDVLKASAADVLPRLLALGPTGRAVWTLYALLPLALVPAALGARTALGEYGIARMRVATLLQWVAAGAMTIGLARWPSLNWGIATEWNSAGVAAQQAMSATFAAGNRWLGNLIGEFVGELALYAAIGLMGSVLLSAWRRGAAGASVRWVGWLCIVTAVVGEVAAWRNVSPLVDPAATLANNLLPLSLIALGVVLVRWREAPGRARTSAPARAPSDDASHSGRPARAGSRDASHGSAELRSVGVGILMLVLGGARMDAQANAADTAAARREPPRAEVEWWTGLASPQLLAGDGLFAAKDARLADGRDGVLSGLSMGVAFYLPFERLPELAMGTFVRSHMSGIRYTVGNRVEEQFVNPFLFGPVLRWRPEGSLRGAEFTFGGGATAVTEKRRTEVAGVLTVAHRFGIGGGAVAGIGYRGQLLGITLVPQVAVEWHAVRVERSSQTSDDWRYLVWTAGVSVRR